MKKPLLFVIIVVCFSFMLISGLSNKYTENKNSGINEIDNLMTGYAVSTRVDQSALVPNIQIVPRNECPEDYCIIGIYNHENYQGESLGSFAGACDDPDVENALCITNPHELGKECSDRSKLFKVYSFENNGYSNYHVAETSVQFGGDAENICYGDLNIVFNDGPCSELGSEYECAFRIWGDTENFGATFIEECQRSNPPIDPRYSKYACAKFGTAAFNAELRCGEIEGHPGLFACNNQLGSGRPDITSLCDNPNSCVDINGNCINGDLGISGINTAELDHEIYGKNTCSNGHWCPLGFIYSNSPDERSCVPIFESCYSPTDSLSCQYEPKSPEWWADAINDDPLDCWADNDEDGQLNPEIDQCCCPNVIMEDPFTGEPLLVAYEYRYWEED